MDYLLLSYAIFVQGYAVPHIAAGINLNLPVIGRLLRKGGAFFIRRSFRGNALYTVVFMKYLAAIMGRGHSIEYFIEGGRSRTGRLLQPKTGMLSMTVRSFLIDPKRPVVFLPVYFGYERLVEANTYIDELSGRPKKKESIMDLLRALRVLREKFGRVHVNLGEPVLLADILDRHQADWRTQKFNDDTRAGWVSRAVDELAQRIMRNINSAAAVTPVNLLATILLATPRQAMLENDLLRQVETYLGLLRGLGYHPRVTFTSMSPTELVSYGLALQVVSRETHAAGDIICMRGDAAILATYYRNNTLHLFALPSLIACAFGSNPVLRTEDLQRLAWRVFPYVSAELFLRWTEAELPQVVDAVIANLANMQLIEAVEGGVAWRRPAPNSPRAIQLSNLAQATIQTVERYYLAVALLRQAGSGQIDTRALIDRCQLMAQRITLLYGINSPEFSDRSLFENFIELLLQRAVIRLDDNDRLCFDEVLLRVVSDAELVLSEQIRHSILQVTHQ
jgi:glycerol-3-phosphate O-acyltransferase